MIIGQLIKTNQFRKLLLRFDPVKVIGKAGHRGRLFFCRFPAFLMTLVSVVVLLALRPMLRPISLAAAPHLAPPQFKHFTFGYSEQFADTLWLRAIQDFDYCERKIDKINCEGKSWLYQMLDLVSELSPHFRTVHSAGPLALTVIISDIEGASKLFDKAVRNFPNDWVILYRAAYHALYEENNRPKAATLLERAARNGAPPWTYSLAGRLYTEAGQRELGERIYQEISQDPNLKEVAERLKKKLEHK